MRPTTLYILIFLFSNSAIGQKNYENEVKTFINDILSDTYTYTFQNYLDDSLRLAKTAPFDFEYTLLKQRIDTSFSKYMLRTDIGKMHFDTIYFVSEPDHFNNDNENDKLIKFLSRDSIFEVKNPFNKLTIKNCVNTYSRHRHLSLSDYFEGDFITENKLNKIFKKNNGWTEFNNKYGNGYIRMTIPIFADDNNYAYFEWSYYCSGLCGYGYAGLYKKQNGKWTPIKVYMKWMS